jgi:hypothetical protein
MSLLSTSLFRRKRRVRRQFIHRATNAAKPGTLAWVEQRSLMVDLKSACDAWGALPEEVMSPCRRDYVVNARRTFAELLYARGWSLTSIALAIGRDRTTVRALLEAVMGAAA